MQKEQRHERSLAWKKMLRRYNAAQLDSKAEAQRKRSARLMTNIRAGLGDAAADTRLDAEVERGKRRRFEERVRALELRPALWRAPAHCECNSRCTHWRSAMR